MPLRLLGLIAVIFAVAVSGLFAAQANTLTDPDGRVRGGTPDSVKVKGLFDMLALQRGVVPFETKEKPGTVIVFTKERKLYLVLGPGQAMRYGIGVGRDGFPGTASHRLRQAGMAGLDAAARRCSSAGLTAAHMKGGPDNPLGARAMYLGSTLYRIHGSNEPDTIGEADVLGLLPHDQ